jgi:hypothetical protein
MVLWISESQAQLISRLKNRESGYTPWPAAIFGFTLAVTSGGFPRTP